MIKPIKLFNAAKNAKYVKSLSKLEKREILSKAENFVSLKNQPKSWNFLDYGSTTLGTMNAAEALLSCYLDKPIPGAMALTVSVLLRENSLLAHKIALKNATNAAKILNKNGFNHDEIKVVVNKILSNDGNVVFSKLFKTLYPKRVNKIAEGQETRSGFIKLF